MAKRIIKLDDKDLQLLLNGESIEIKTHDYTPNIIISKEDSSPSKTVIEFTGVSNGLKHGLNSPPIVPIQNAVKSAILLLESSTCSKEW